MGFKGKKILVGITAGIAAYKVAILVRELVKNGAEVQVLMSPDAHAFVTPLTLATLSERPVMTDFYNKETGSWNNHVALGLWADLFVIAPLTANTMGKMVNAMSDNLLLATYLSARCPVCVAPAMDLDMYAHPATQRNLQQLAQDGVHIIPAENGLLASGLSGLGRMAEPQTILNHLSVGLLNGFNPILKGKKILISAGPTYEKIDTVRFIGNFSSGKMGYELAFMAAALGAEVQLISGPSNLTVEHPKIHITKVSSAEEMKNACLKHFPAADIAIMAAAIADFTPAQIADKKIKKQKTETLELELLPTVDVLAAMGEMKEVNQFLVGFALEDHNEKTNAMSKINIKNLDLIVLNSLNDHGAGFATDTNKVLLIDKNLNETPFNLAPKKEIAFHIINYISQHA